MLICDKFKVSSFNRSSKNLLPCEYNLNGVELEEVEYMKDLGVMFDKKFTFEEHVIK